MYVANESPRRRSARAAAGKTAGWCLKGLACVALAACATGTTKHPEDMGRLLSESPAPPAQKYTPMFEEEQVEFQERMGPTDYRLGVGDSIEITENTKVLGVPTAAGMGSFRARIKQDGNIYLPEFGAVPAKGQTVIELQESLLEKLQKFSDKPFATIDVVDYKSQKYYMLGTVNGAGVASVDGSTTLLDAVSRGGGVSPAADLDTATVIRKGKILPISLADIMLRGDLSRNIVMQDKDIIYVPSFEDKRVYVLGEVKSPGVVPMIKGRISLLGAIMGAGGLDNATADDDSIKVFRGNWYGPKSFTVSRQELLIAGESIQLMAGDRVVVGPNQITTATRAIGLASPIMFGLTNTLLGTALTIDSLTDGR